MIGILALQGNVLEHRENLERHGVRSRCIRMPAELPGIAGLILPGGESTAMRRLIVSAGLEEPVQALIREGLPVWGTCAGVVLLAKGGIWQSVPIEVERNAYGSQIYSRVAQGRSTITARAFPMVFIRAPRISALAENIEILAEVEGDIVAIRYQNILLTTFHPELTPESPFTSYFLEMVRHREGLSPATPATA